MDSNLCPSFLPLHTQKTQTQLGFVTSYMGNANQGLEKKKMQREMSKLKVYQRKKTRGRTDLEEKQLQEMSQLKVYLRRKKRGCIDLEEKQMQREMSPLKVYLRRKTRGCIDLKEKQLQREMSPSKGHLQSWEILKKRIPTSSPHNPPVLETVQEEVVSEKQ
ncbi:hypothetical protein LWI28_004789 [Acer negundo]|uniref:Uncharacterized protein n=1 Tax=Acer negundo TaxID=4023 RepID=A0AAD5IT00_ACENE|nr:hypothetical protein LWI28_004789 [Acer negundo]